MPLLAHTVRPIVINGAVYRVAMPQSAELVLNTIPDTKFESLPFAPYWAELWPAAKALAAFLDKQTIPVSCLIGDMGCGLGLCSMILARHNAPPVSFDISLNAALFARFNLAAMNQRSKVVCCDWQALPFKCRFDMIVGADLLYEETQIMAVIAVLDQLLLPQGVAYLADPQRPYWNGFKQAIVDSNLFQSTTVIDTRMVEHSTIEILKIVK